jgi:hypothetical protein
MSNSPILVPPPPAQYKTVTHVAAGLLSMLIAFSVTPAGQALVHQYPYLTGIVALASTLAAIYHVPVKGQP